MARDFDLLVYKFYGGHNITIVPIADVHLGSEECMEESFVSFIDSVKNTPNVYLTLGGDLIDNGTKNSVTNVYRQTMRPSEQKRRMAEILEPVADRLLCAVSGNHERRSSSGKSGVDDDPTYDILCKIDKEEIYRENMAVMKIQLGVPETENGARSSGQDRPCYSIVVCHGSGGGMLPGAAINRGQRFGYVFSGMMDALIVGHTHVPYNAKYKKINIDVRNNRISFETFKVVCATSWLEYGDYPVQKMLLPTAFADQSLVLSGKTKSLKCGLE